MSRVSSGQFMISDLTEDETVDGEVREQAEPRKRRNSIYKYTKGNRTFIVDGSLQKMFNCLTLAYSGKLASPKWKVFRGLQVSVKDTVRINNIIWREWCRQFNKSHRPTVCHFNVPTDEVQHTKVESVVLEGKYWKRKMGNITAEYRKWRVFGKDKLRGMSQKRLAELAAAVPQPEPSGFELMDFTDTLFNSLSGSVFEFPNPRELRYDCTNMASLDLLQPGLTQLQPPGFESLNNFSSEFGLWPSLSDTDYQHDAASYTLLTDFGADYPSSSSTSRFSNGVEDSFIQQDSLSEYSPLSNTSLLSTTTQAENTNSAFSPYNVMVVRPLATSADLPPKKRPRVDVMPENPQLNIAHVAPLRKDATEEERAARKRQVHISAEQRRRGYVNYNMDQLAALLPDSDRGTRRSQANTLLAFAEHFEDLRSEAASNASEEASLLRERERLHASIAARQARCSQSRPQGSPQQMWRSYCQMRTAEDPNFSFFAQLLDAPVAECLKELESSRETSAQVVASWRRRRLTLATLREALPTALQSMT